MNHEVHDSADVHRTKTEASATNGFDVAHLVSMFLNGQERRIESFDVSDRQD